MPAQQSVRHCLESQEQKPPLKGNPIHLPCGTLRVEYFSDFEFSLPPSRIHARPSASQRKPLGACMIYFGIYEISDMGF